MLPLFGQERALIDSNGRVKLCPRFVTDFEKSGNGEVVLFSLPERGIAIYPEETFLRMRRFELDEAEKSFKSIISRRELRFFGSMTYSEKISNQGRITIPHFMRDACGILPNSEVVLIGIQLGIEIWSCDNWSLELEKIRKHSDEKADREMASDLIL